MIKVAMIRIHQEMKKRNLRSRMILQVHDELLFDVYIPEKEIVEEIVKSGMQNAMKLHVPLEVSAGYGQDWLQAH
jgi:DNA polymerase-1